MAIEGEVALPSGELAEVSLRAAAVAALEDITLPPGTLSQIAGSMVATCLPCYVRTYSHPRPLTV